jgi:hypothetical protein
MADTWTLTPADSVIQLSKWKTQLPDYTACLRTCFKIAGYEANSAKAMQLYQYVAITNKNFQTEQVGQSMNFKEAINAIDLSLQIKVPVIAGVYRSDKKVHASNEGKADHFVVIVGKGLDKGRPYYRFVDPGTDKPQFGTSPENRFYVDDQKKMIRGNTSYGSRTTYIVSQVRPK